MLAEPQTFVMRAESPTFVMLAESPTSVMRAEPPTFAMLAEPQTFVMRAESPTFVMRAESPTFVMRAESCTRMIRPLRTSRIFELPATIQQPSTINSRSTSFRIIATAFARRIRSAFSATSGHHAGSASSSSRHCHVDASVQSTGVNSTLTKCLMN